MDAEGNIFVAGAFEQTDRALGRWRWRRLLGRHHALLRIGGGLRGSLSSRFAVFITNVATMTALRIMSFAWMRS